MAATADTTAGTASAAREPNASVRTWIAMVGCMLGALMSSLDIQVTNASLPQIEGGIGTGIANGTWICTAYLVGEMIMIPMADYLSRVFSFRRFLLGGTVAFLFCSMGCAFTTNLDQMIVLRGLQGFSAGAMIPLAMTFVLSNLPLRQQAIGMAIFALTVTFGPAIGPTLGGWLTTHFGWRYVFFVNLVPGTLMLALLYPTLERAPIRLGLLREGDWWGIIFLIVGMSCLQTMLNEGNRYNWFDSPYIVKLGLVAGIALAVFVVIELTVEKPLVELRLFAYRNFTLGTVAGIMVGVLIFGSIYVLPTYLSEVQGYDAQQVGAVMAWAGIPQLFIIPFMPLLIKHFDPRVLIIFGIGVMAASCFMDTHLSANFAGDQFMNSNLVRGVGQAVTMTPLTMIAFIGIPQAISGQASGVFNMTRNLGGSLGTAMLSTIITRRSEFHGEMIGAAAPSTDPVALKFLGDMQAYFLQHGVPDPARALHQAEILLARLAQKQALIMGYADAFYVMGWMLVAAIVAVAFTRGKA